MDSFLKRHLALSKVSPACATAFNKYTVSKFFDSLLEVLINISIKLRTFLIQMKQYY